ncbi:hypothetical protein [Methanogenium organophilum]|uniref:Uncharacterized protein n=1 Tax=Methanogenium organophilum TaxID=2199 RepID=A0A9X9S4E7_METOG|nr:hypothetical protein [Methanogenium organophilum]WAI01799.1 hypothetical protein OU421_02685 [Methanogenium organophilum]
MQPEPGTLALAGGGTLSLSLAEETYSLTRDDIHTLLFYGQSVPLTRTNETDTGTSCGAVVPETVIDGHITVHASGRAVLATTRAGHFAIPFASFQQVARGEAVSAPLFPAVPNTAGGFL